MRAPRLAIPLALAGLGLAGAAAVWGAGGSAIPDAASRTWTVVERPFRHSVVLAGTLTAGHTVSVASPFAGLVRSRLLDVGHRAGEGEPVLELDTADLEAATREARAALLKAEQQVDSLRNWIGGTEATRARRAHQAASAALGDVALRLRETKGLVEQGIVARMELDAIQQQMGQARLQEQNARLDLDATLARGGPAAQEIATVERESALRKWAALRAAADQAVVRSPVSGILLRPTLATGTDAPVPERGTLVRQGEPLFAVADDSALVVVAQVDEFEVHRLAVGMSATVTPTGLPDLALEGRIQLVGAIAKPNATGGGSRFEVRVAIEGAQAARDRLRLGMTCTVSVTVRDLPAAIVVPPEALAGDRREASVTVLDAGGERRTKRVQLGFPALDGIEVTSGLSPGEVLLLAR